MSQRQEHPSQAIGCYSATVGVEYRGRWDRDFLRFASVSAAEYPGPFLHLGK